MQFVDGVLLALEYQPAASQVQVHPIARGEGYRHDRSRRPFCGALAAQLDRGCSLMEATAYAVREGPRRPYQLTRTSRFLSSNSPSIAGQLVQLRMMLSARTRAQRRVPSTETDSSGP